MIPMRSIIDEIDKGRSFPHSWSYQGLSSDDAIHLSRANHKLKIYRGKVRDCLSIANQLWVIHSDRLSAFDCAIGLAPLRGIIIKELTTYWYNVAKNNDIPIVEAHTLTPRVLATENVEPIKAEIIVRGYLAGSMQHQYQSGDRSFCGHQLPNNLLPWSQLPTPIITPTSKAKAFEHDLPTSAAALIDQGLLNANEWHAISHIALDLFRIGSAIFRQHGWILADTKYEFGRNQAGHIVVIDEIHTPDSSRLWSHDGYLEQLKHGLAPTTWDKDLIRRKLLQEGFSGHGIPPVVPDSLLLKLTRNYLNVCESLLGHPLTIPDHANKIHLDTLIDDLSSRK